MGIISMNRTCIGHCPCQSGELFQLTLVDARLRYAVQLDRDAAFQRRLQARLHGGEFVPGGDVPEHRGVQSVEADVHTVKARRQ